MRSPLSMCKRHGRVGEKEQANTVMSVWQLSAELDFLHFFSQLVADVILDFLPLSNHHHFSGDPRSEDPNRANFLHFLRLAFLARKVASPH